MSDAQQHRVLRLVIELAGCSREQAGALQTALRQRYQHDWLPAIERLCNTLGQPGRVQRIDRLEIDLGSLPGPALLHGASVAQFDAVFAERLEDALRTAPGPDIDIDSDLELVDFFLHTGALPWWADSADRLALQHAVRALLHSPSPAWAALLGGLADQPRQRLVATLDDGLLAQLLDQQLAAGLGAAPGSAWPPALHPAWQHLLVAAAGTLALPAQTLRRAWWQAALAAAAAPGAAAPLHRWLPGALAGMASGLGLATAALQQALHQAVDGAGADATHALAPLRALLAGPGRADGRASAPPPAAVPAVASDVLADGPSARVSDDEGDEGDEGHGGDGGDGGDRGYRGDGAPTSANAPPAAISPGPGRDAGEPDTHPAPPAPASAETQPGSVAALPISGATALRPSLAAAPQQRRETALQQRREIARQHGHAEALYLANAGLVLLWPFLPRFVEQLGLRTDAGWRNRAAAQRAARLLQCVASGDADPPEFQLPLNKLLCGLPLDDALLDCAPLTEPEQAECSALLVAVIAQAPILREMSVAGFRGSFLLRPGQLSSRDGHWLLRVERQAYDVVIDRFPWGFAVVRLPWMPTLLQVQW